jgi:hypothetical protein
MLGPVRTVVSATAPEAADWNVLLAVIGRPESTMSPDGDRRVQARTQALSWRARPSTSSRRKLTAATRSDHHRSLRWMPR